MRTLLCSHVQCIFNVKFIIDEKYSGSSVLSFVRSLNISTTLLKRMKQRENGITVNGDHVTVRYVLSVGDELFLDDSDTFEDENPHIVPSELPLDIIYEDDDVFVLNKPHSMPTHPSHGHYEDTLANSLCSEYRKRGLPFVFRAVNRLDADTSGAVLVARSSVSAYVLSQSMMAGKIRKIYIAVLDGEMDSPLNEWRQYTSFIRREGDSIIKRISVNEGSAKEFAVTNYNCIYKGGGHSVVLAEPITGRTHQLRVHFSHLGYPISGDDFYGGSLSLIKRQALHAIFLSFPKTANGDTVAVNAEIPEDMAKIINSFMPAEYEKRILHENGI